MAKKNDDDLAAALNAMASGDGEPDASHDSSSGTHVEMQAATPPPTAPRAPAVPPRARPPVAPPAVSPRASAPSVAASPSAGPPRPATRAGAPSARSSSPSQATPPPATPRATGDGTPAARVRSAAPQSRAAAPSVPAAPPLQATESDSPFDHAPPDDDDAVIMPAPDESVFAPRAKSAPVVRKAKVPVYQTLHFRQTVIPIMLTSGVLSLVLAGIRFSLPDDSFFAAVPTIVAIVLVIMGIMLLGFGIINMLMVKQMLEDAKKA